MYDLFGPGFYEWWAGLSRGGRLAVAAIVLVSSGAAGFFFFDAWLIYVPAAIVGTVLLLAA